MKIPTFLGTLALTLLPIAVPAQSAPPFSASDMCHYMGSWASQAAISRTNGMPVSNVLDIVHQMSASASLQNADRKFISDFAAQVERIVLAVYASDLSPNSAYTTYRGQCQKVMDRR